jgi:DNA-binding response OmpR family regulator
MPPRVLAIDDERYLRKLLELDLPEYGFDVRTVADGPTGIRAVREWNPDAIVLDVMLPYIDGIELVPQLRRITEAPILMLSAKSDLGDKVSSLQAGADDYLAKPFSMSELAARLETALRRPKLERFAEVAYHDLVLDVDRREARRAGRRIDLSSREWALLHLLVTNPERIFSRTQLLDLVWGSDRDVRPGIVETYVSYLRSKIDQGQPVRLIRTVRGAGYALRAD